MYYGSRDTSYTRNLVYIHRGSRPVYVWSTAASVVPESCVDAHWGRLLCYNLCFGNIINEVNSSQLWALQFRDTWITLDEQYGGILTSFCRLLLAVFGRALIPATKWNWNTTLHLQLHLRSEKTVPDRQSTWGWVESEPTSCWGWTIPLKTFNGSNLVFATDFSFKI